MKMRASALMSASTSSSSSLSAAIEDSAWRRLSATRVPRRGRPSSSTQAQVRERGREPENSLHCQSQDWAERLNGSRPVVKCSNVIVHPT